jgi:hypothetical protein
MTRLLRDSALLTPTLHFLIQLLPHVFHVLHHLVDLLSSISTFALTQTVPNTSHQIHDSEKLIREPSDDGAATSGLQILCQYRLSILVRLYGLTVGWLLRRIMYSRANNQCLQRKLRTCSRSLKYKTAVRASLQQ